MLTRVRVSSAFFGLLLFGLAGTTSFAQVGTTTVSTPTTSASPSTTQTQVIEWDVSNMVSTDPSGNAVVDGRPGAVNVDLYANGGRRVWFTTRDGPVPRVFMLQPPANLKYGSAQWTSWSLNPTGVGPTGGLKKLRSSQDRRFVFVRTVMSLQRIDTATNLVTSYCDDATAANVNPLPPAMPSFCNNASGVSDVAIDSRNNVYSAANGVLERVNASADSCAASPCPFVTITTWDLNPSATGGTSTAGNCQTTSADSSPCISGVAIDPRHPNLIYVAEPDPNNNTIVEVDVSCGAVRRWNVSAVGASQPRQINIDQDGIVWTVTGSGHLVSLDPQKSVMAAYTIPGALNDPFGVAPDAGVVGYTAFNPDITGSGADQHKVAMLVPKAKGTYVCPQPGTAPQGSVLIEPMPTQAIVDCGSTPGIARTVNTLVTPSGDGTFVEAFINQNTSPNARSSALPLGIAPDFDKAVGTFFYAVGTPTDNPSVDRIGFARLPRTGLKAKHEREDKDCDDDGTGHDDQDHDGIPDQYKTNNSKSNMDRQNDSLAPGQSMDYNLTTDSTAMAVVAAIQSDNALEPVSVQVIDPNGITLALPVATPGLAVATVIPTVPGSYTIRVKNEGVLPINPETQLITREPLSLP